MFSNESLKKLIIPIFMDQILIIIASIIATMMISYAGEAAVSAVSLIDMINNASYKCISSTYCWWSCNCITIYRI
ncbi:hypothetical protein AB2T96_19205 [Clostridium butyricum]|uniref:hypothetical protein n=1 Tax=Clostridium butyricum TaxID=1492 RepID=UPI003466DB2F